MTDTPPDQVEEAPKATPAGQAEPQPGHDSAAPSTGGADGTGTDGGRGRSALLWGCLVLLVALAGVQTAGVLLRDRLEGRQERGGLPPVSPAGRPPPGAAAAPAPGSRFGPGVREVVVAEAPAEPAASASPASPAPAGDPASAGETPATPTAQAAPPQAPTPPPAPPEQPSPPPTTPAPPAAARTPPPTPPPPAAARDSVPPPSAAAPRSEGTHVLQMGVFRSQKYRRETEERLTALSISHYRTEGTRSGAGYRLTVPTPDATAADRAERALAQGGYAHRPTEEGIEVRFFLEEEAQAAMDLLAGAGFRVGYMRVEGETPLWTVYAGPYDLDEAKAVRERLLGEGLDSYLRRRP